MTKAATSLRPHIVQVMAANQGRILTTEDIYQLVADQRVLGFNPGAKRDRNLVNRELSDLAGCTTQGHSKPSPQVIMRVSRGRYLYREPDRPMDLALLQEYLEPVEVYEKQPARRRRSGSDRRSVTEEVRMGLYAVAAGRVSRLRVSPATSPAVRGGSHSGPERRRQGRGPQPAALVLLLQSGKGNPGEQRVQDEDGGAAGPQRGRGNDGGRAASGAHRPAADPVSPGRKRVVGMNVYGWHAWPMRGGTVASCSDETLRSIDYL